MDLKNLSSNWKKLQETLKKDSSSGPGHVKHKASGRETHVGHAGVKRRRAEVTHEKPSKQHKKRRMSERHESGSEKEETPNKSISKKTSIVSIREKSQPQFGEPNEGRSTTSVVFPIVLFF